MSITPERIQQVVTVIVGVLGVLLPKLAQLEPTWTWIGYAITLVALIAGTEQTGPKAAKAITALRASNSILTADLSRKS